MVVAAVVGEAGVRCCVVGVTWGVVVTTLVVGKSRIAGGGVVGVIVLCIGCDDRVFRFESVPGEDERDAAEECKDVAIVQAHAHRRRHGMHAVCPVHVAALDAVRDPTAGCK